MNMLRVLVSVIVASLLIFASARMVLTSWQLFWAR